MLSEVPRSLFFILILIVIQKETKSTDSSIAGAFSGLGLRKSPTEETDETRIQIGDSPSSEKDETEIQVGSPTGQEKKNLRFGIGGTSRVKKEETEIQAEGSTSPQRTDTLIEINDLSRFTKDEPKPIKAKSFGRTMSMEEREAEEPLIQAILDSSPSSTRPYVSEIDEHEPDDLEEAFKVFDEDGDGQITETELKKRFEALNFKHETDETIRAMIAKYDQDGDGKINYLEFVAMMNKPRAKDGLLEMFNSLDVNGDGLLSQNELPFLNNEEKKRLMAMADSNKDGFIDLTEFRVLMAKRTYHDPPQHSPPPPPL